MEFAVNLNKVEDVKEFVRLAELYDIEIFVRDQDKKYLVNGASIMGIFSLDLSRPIIVHIRNMEAGEAFKESISKFTI